MPSMLRKPRRSAVTSSHGGESIRPVHVALMGRLLPLAPHQAFSGSVSVRLLLLVLGASGAPLLAGGRLGKMEGVRDPGRATATTHRRRRLSLGLRARVTVAFAIAGLVLAGGRSL